MGLLNSLFGLKDDAPADPQHSGDLQAVEKILKNYPDKQARLVAAMALACARVAHVDLEIDDEEKRRIQEALTRFAHLDEKMAADVAEIAMHRTMLVSIESHLVLRHLCELSTREQKIEILRSLFHVAAANDITERESEEIAQISRTLLFSREEFLAIRSEFRDHLKLLKNLPGA